MNKEILKENYKLLKNEINITLKDIENIIITCENFEGNCFYLNKSFALKEELFTKQLNLYILGCKNYVNICEIGFNAGHSSLLLLLGNISKNIHFTIFDINMHEYTIECFKYICNKFPSVDFEFVEGDSVISIPNWIEKTKKYDFFDIIHVDGGHALEIITNDFVNSIKILKKNGIIIIDDVQKMHINNLVEYYLSIGMLQEIKDEFFETSFYPHRILKKII